MPFPLRMLGGIAKSILPWVGFGAAAGATEHFLGGAGGAKPKDRYSTRKAEEVVIDRETGEIIDYKARRRKKRQRLPKYAQEALKTQAELTKSITEFIKVMMFKELAQKED